MNVKHVVHTKVDDASLKIGLWLKRTLVARKQLSVLSANASALQLLASKVEAIISCTSPHRAQQLATDVQLAKSVEVLLRACFAVAGMRDTNISQHSRLLVTGLLVSKFPEEFLQGSEHSNDSNTSTAYHVEEETGRCVLDARILLGCLKRVLSTATGRSSRFALAANNLCLTMKWFHGSFNQWRMADSRRTAMNLEESFMETYSVYLAALHGPDDGTDPRGPSKAELVQATQRQLEKIRAALERVVGKQAAANRIEEISAAVEAALASAQAEQRAGGDASAESSPRLTTETNTTSSQGSDAASLSRTRAISVEAADAAAHRGEGPTEGALTHGQLKVLDKLAALSGMAQERLAYEIVLNPFYRLPQPNVPVAEPGSPVPRGSNASSNLNSAQDGESSSPRSQTLAAAVSLQDTSSVVQSLKARMLRVMADKLVNSLRRSPLTSLSQVSVGQEIQVFFMPNGQVPEVGVAGTGSTSVAYTRTPVLTARVLAVHGAAASRSSSPTPRSASPGPAAVAPELTVDIVYTSDGVREDGVSAGRIVLADSAVPDPTLLIRALQDLAQQIASFTPNRPDIQQEVMAAVDAPLLSQMIVNRAMDPVTDLLPILQYFQRSLAALQAPSRTAQTEAWVRAFAESFYKVDPVGSAGSVASSGQRRGKSMDEVAPLLPGFFERASAVVEEIQRDMANYYISVLAPVLQQQGAEYLKERFQMRLQNGLASLDATASLIYGQLIPTETFQNTIRDLAEAGICQETGVNLTDVVPSGESAPPSHGAAPGGTAMVDGIVAHAMLALLQLPFRLDSPEAARIVPETLVWDATRLSAMRDLVDRIALGCSLLIACKQVLARYQLPAWCSDAAAEVELQHRLDVLLTEHDATMASITTEVVRYVMEALNKFRQAHLAATTGGAVFQIGASPRAMAAVPASHPALVGGDAQEVYDRVSKGLKDVVANGNPVLALFSKRIYKVLLRAMLGQGFKQLLPSYSLQSPAQQRNLTQLIQSACRLFSHTMKVHRDVYTLVISRAVASASESVVANA